MKHEKKKKAEKKINRASMTCRMISSGLTYVPLESQKCMCWVEGTEKYLNKEQPDFSYLMKL